MNYFHVLQAGIKGNVKLSTIEDKAKQLFIDEGIISEACTFRSLSGGRTNSVWKISGSADLICKLYAKSTQNPLYENSPTSEYGCLQQFAGQKIAPNPIAFFETDFGELLVYDYLKGTTWKSGVSELAQTLALVHAAPVLEGLRQLPVGVDGLTVQTLNILASVDEKDAEIIQWFLPEIKTSYTPKRCLVHTDVVPANIIKTDQGLRLIDWQCPGVGDPVEDLAMFISPAMQHIYRGKLLSSTEQKDFLLAYPDADVRQGYLELAPMYHWRMAAYCAWKEARGADEYADAKLLEIAALQDLGQ
jgi:fructosamine-3-kinase